MKIVDEVMDSRVSDYAATLPLSQAKDIYTAYKNKELYLPFQIPEEHKNEKIMLGAAQRFGQSLEIIPEGIGIVGGQVGLFWGNIFKSVPLSLSQAMGNEFTKAGETFLNAANSSLEAKRKRQAQQLLPLTEEEMQSPLYKLTGTGLDYASQIGLALLTGGTASLAAMGVRMEAETAVEGLEKYKQAHPEDKTLSGYKEFGNISKELLLSAEKTAVNLYVERAIGVPKQVSQFKKALKAPSVGIVGVGKAAAKGYAMGFGEEWATETIQGVTDTTFDAFLGRMKDMPELMDAYKQSIGDAVYAGIFGGSFGASGHVMARGQAISQVKQALSNVVPAEDLNNVATAIVDSHIAETKTMIATQLALSTQLRDKHGAIFNAMNVAAKQAMMNSGVTKTMTEDEIAQHSTELATLFADQVLAEANKRNVPIMDVIQDKDIVYDPVKNELRLAPPKQERTTQKIEEKKKKIREKKKQVAEGIKTPEEIALERKKEDTDITDLEEIERDNLDALRMIAFRVADDIDAEFGDTETDFLDLAQVVGDESSLNDNMHMALMMAIPEGYETDDYQIQKKKEIFEEFGLRLAYEPGVYKDYAQIGFDEYMNRVTEAWDRSVLRRDLPVFLQESAEIDTESKNYIQKFKDFVGKAFRNKITEKEKGKPFIFGNTPKALINVGIPQNKIAVKVGIIDKSHDGRNEGHKLDAETVGSVLEALHKPIAITKDADIENQKTNNRYGILLDLRDKSGNYVMVGLEANKRIGNDVFAVVNDIRTIHSRESFVPMLDKAVKDKRLLGVNLDKIKSLLSATPDVISGRSLIDSKKNILQNLDKVKTYFQSAFAGSRVDYDRPSLEAIGSGEGNQAHGWGLYYALDRDVAEDYREKFTTQGFGKRVKSVKYNGKEINDNATKTSLIGLRNTNKENAIDLIKRNIKYADDETRGKWEKLKDFIENVDESKIDVIYEKGQVHEVDIPESPYLLDEQKTVNEQSDYVKDVLEKEGIIKPSGMSLEETIEYLLKKYAKGEQKDTVEAIINHFKENGDIEGFTYRMANGVNTSYEDIHLLDYYNTTGEEIYEKLSKKFGSDKKASEYLESKGIKGITYYGRQDGRCFVIFNPDDVKVIQKFYQGKTTQKGLFDANSKVIKLFENADASTLEHELAHYWLDNMWTYATSGAASETYKTQFQAVKDFLNVKPEQKWLTAQQHEKFASAYEKYIHRGIIPNSIMGNVFDNYERFIRKVYNSIDDIRAQGKKSFKLTPEIIKFFDSMLTGGIDTGAIEGSMAVEARNEEAQKADDTTMREAKSVVEEMPEREVMPEVKPVQVKSETKESRLFNRLKGLAGAEGAVEYNVAHIKEQRELARKMWKENPQKANAILKGTETADDVLRQALYTEQQRLALENGDTNTFLNSLRKQTAEATRMGQELSALRGVAEDITDPAYWIRSAETEALKNLAKKQTKNLENAVGNSPLMELTARLDKDIKALQKEVMSKKTDDEKMKALKEGVKSIADKYQGLEQLDTVFNQIDWGNEDYAIDYIENKVKEKLGIALPKETAKAFIQTAHDLDALSKQRDEFGNPTEAFFVKKDELERMRNSHTPTSRTKILVSTIGRGNMLTAPSTSVLNAVSNTQNYFVENTVRKVANILEGKTNDNIVDKELMNKYRGLAWRTFWDTGYDMSFMTSLLDERLYKGESVSHSEGAGWIRGLGRWTEKYVFSRLISSPDIYFKSVLGFTNYVGNEATNIAYQEGLTGDKAKARANELFRDAIKIEPETDLGKQIRLKAQTDALILTFQQDSKFSEMLLKVRDAINKGTGDIGIGDIMSPFIKTPANILSMSFDAAVGPFASPVNFIGALNDIKNKNYRSARVVQMAKQTTTAALAYVIIGLLASMLIDDDDYIPDYAQLTPKERAIVRARGGSFGSVKIGNKFISTDFFGTFEMPLVTFLNARRTGNILKGIAGGVGAKFVDAPVLKDILGSSDAIKDMATSKDDIISAIGENVANAAISRLTPNALNAVAKVIDDKDRKINNVMDKVISRIPFARQTLDEKLNVTTGQAQELGRLNTILFGSRGKDMTENVLAAELGRLADVGEVVNITDPTKSGDLSKLSDADKLKIQDMFAIEYAKKAGQLVKTSSYSNKTDEGKKDALNDVRKDVLDSIKRKYRKEIKTIQKNKRKRVVRK